MWTLVFRSTNPTPIVTTPVTSRHVDILSREGRFVNLQILILVKIMITEKPCEVCQDFDLGSLGT